MAGTEELINKHLLLGYSAGGNALLPKDRRGRGLERSEGGESNAPRKTLRESLKEGNASKKGGFVGLNAAFGKLFARTRFGPRRTDVPRQGRLLDGAKGYGGVGDF